MSLGALVCSKMTRFGTTEHVLRIERTCEGKRRLCKIIIIVVSSPV